LAESKNRGFFAKRGVLLDIFYVQINILKAKINNLNMIRQKLSNIINAIALMAGSKKKVFFAKIVVLFDGLYVQINKLLARINY
jgi:hypothetical protein